MPDYIDLRESNRSFDVIAAAFQWSANATGGDAERLQGRRATSSLFTALGTPAALGRTLIPEDESGAGKPVVVLSHGLWKRRFGGDPNVLGSPLVLNGETIPSSAFCRAPLSILFARQILSRRFPISTDPRRTARDLGFLRVIGRLRPDVTVEHATRDLDAIVARLRIEYPTTNATHAGTNITEWHSVLIARVGRAARLARPGTR